MDSDNRRQDARKAMAYDLCNIFDGQPSGKTYTKEEIKSLIREYVSKAD